MRSIAKWFRAYDLLLFMLAGALILLYVLTAGGGFPLDDSWIHHVYGRNLATTGQWAFIPGEVSAASTSPLYTVLLALGYALNVSYAVWPHLLGWLGLSFCGLFGARLAALLLPNRRLIAPLTGVAIISSWHLLWAAASSMETVIFCAFTLLLIRLAWRETDTAAQYRSGLVVRAVIFGAAAALTTLTRPEGIVLVAWIGLLLLLLRPQSLQATLIYGVVSVIAFLLVMSPYLIFNLQLTGGLLPDTAAAKQAEAAFALALLSYPERVWEMLKPLVAGGQLLLLPGILLFVWDSSRRLLRRDLSAVWSLLPLLWALSLVALYAARLPAPYQHGRYVMPALPSLILIGVVGTFRIMDLGRSAMLGRVLTRSLAVSTVLVFVYFALVGGPAVYRREVRIINEEMVATAHWVLENIPPEDLLATHDIGAIGYFAPRPIVDTAGLISPDVVPYILNEEAMWEYLENSGARYFMALPSQIPGESIDDPRLCRVYMSSGTAAREVGGGNMSVYALEWDGDCNN